MTIIWHNPRCSKSRQTLALLEDNGVQAKIRIYLKDAPSDAELRDVLMKLSASPRDIVRKGETLYQELGLKNADDAALLAAMVANPILIERPIVINGDKAAIGRPPENVLSVL